MTVFNTPGPFDTSTTPRMAAAAKPTRDGTEVIASTAIVEPGATVIEGGRVRDHAHLSGRPTVSNNALVRDFAQVHDFATVTNRAVVGGGATVCGSAIVDAAEVTGTAYIADYARVHMLARPKAGVIDMTADIADQDHYIAVGPVGSEARVASFYRAFNPEKGTWVGVVAAGCFRGTIDKLLHRLEVKEGWSTYNFTQNRIDLWDAQYRAFAILARTLQESWGEPTERDLAWWNERSKDAGWGYMTDRMAGYGLLS